MKTLIKRLFTLLIVATLGVGSIYFTPSNVKADEYVPSIFAEDIKNNDIKYTYSNGTLIATGTGYADASYSCLRKDIKKIVISDGVKGIADYAFGDCTHIQAISIPSSVKEIGFYAFSGANLPTTTIPSTTKKIGATAFTTRNPFSITLPGDFEPIWTGYLEDYDNRISFGFKTVHLNAPYNPANKTQFAANKIYTMKNDPKYKSYKGVVYSKNGKTLVQVPSNMKKVNIRKGCTKILVSSLCYYRTTEDERYVMSNATKITIPKTVKKIVNDMEPNHPFFESKTKWVVKSNKLTGESVENLCTMMSAKAEKKFLKSKKARLKKGKHFKISKDNVLVRYTGKKKTVKIPKKVKRISQDAFSSNKHIKKLVLNKKLKSIGAFAFQCCGNLKKVTWNKKLKSIGDRAFELCNIQTLKVPKSVKKWGEAVFAHNSGKKIVIPKNMKVIPSEMFAGNQVNNIVIPKTVEIIGDRAFAYSANKNITISEGVKKIGYAAFDECGKLDKVVIPSTVQEIEASAFIETIIKKLVLKNPRVVIGSSAFLDVKQIDLGTNPANYFTVASLGMTDMEGNIEFNRIKVLGASGMDFQASKSKYFTEPFDKKDIENKSGYVAIKTPNKDYNFYRIRVYTNKNGNKVYGPWKTFSW